jgi:geranylgeranyl diphosphate synthase type I
MRRIVGESGEPTLLYGMLAYHLGWVDERFAPVEGDGGKHIRPTILLLTTEAQQGVWRQALPAAVAVELFHAFTLIHDDIEDRDTLRRGRPTLWSVWGVPQAINAGDALFAISYRAMLELNATGVSPHRVLVALGRFTETVIRITEGQCRDLQFEEEVNVDESTYLEMIAEKTAALIGLAAELGGIIAGCTDARAEALREFGEALGRAYQMHDDLLSLWGDPQQTGKPVGSDLRRHKKTLPILHGLARSRELRDILSSPDLDESQIHRALRVLEDVGSRSYTEAKVAAFHREALSALARSEGIGEAHETLTSLAERLAYRQK